MMNDNRRRLIVSLLLVGATLVVYGQVAGHGYILCDDDIHVYLNTHVESGLSWANLVWAFQIHGPSQWHPLAWLSHQLDCELFGLNPAGHHVVNLVLHLISVVLLCAVLEKMTGAFWPSALVAALFALHPLHVESVAWISERRDVLCGLFFMLTLASYVRYARRGGLGRYLLVITCFALGLMSKPMLVTLPFLLLLLDVWPLKRMRLRWIDPAATGRPSPAFPPQPIARLVGEKLPMLALSAVSSVLTVLCQRSVGALFSLEAVPLSSRLANAPLSYVAYLRKMVWPVDLALFYSYPAVFSAWRVAGAVLFLAAVTIVVLLLAKRRPWLAVGWFWYVGTLVPVIGLVQAGDQAMADRFTYLPLIGVYVMIAFGGADLARRWTERRELRAVLGLAAAAVLAALAACTWTQAGYWRNSVTVYERAYRINGGHPEVHRGLASALEAVGSLNDAMEHYRQAIQRNPGDHEARNYLGLMLAARGQLRAALEQYREALRLKPDFAVVHNNMGNALVALDLPDEALEHFHRAIQLNPDYAEPYNNLGIVLARRNELDEGIRLFRKAIELNPHYAEPHFNVGSVLRARGAVEEAMVSYRRFLDIQLDRGRSVNQTSRTAQPIARIALAHTHLATLLAQEGKLGEAVEHFQQAADLMPDEAQSQVALAEALRQAGREIEAVDQYQRALAIDPGSLPAALALARLRATHPDAQLRRGDEAVRLAVAACQATGYRQPVALDTLAAAYAEQGRFHEAAATAEKALDLVESAQAKAEPGSDHTRLRRYAAQIKTRLEQYRRGEPFREDARNWAAP